MRRCGRRLCLGLVDRPESPPGGGGSRQCRRARGGARRGGRRTSLASSGGRARGLAPGGQEPRDERRPGPAGCVRAGLCRGPRRAGRLRAPRRRPRPGPACRAGRGPGPGVGDLVARRARRHRRRSARRCHGPCRRGVVAGRRRARRPVGPPPSQGATAVGWVPQVVSRGHRRPLAATDGPLAGRGRRRGDRRRDRDVRSRASERSHC